MKNTSAFWVAGLSWLFGVMTSGCEGPIRAVEPAPIEACEGAGCEDGGSAQVDDDDDRPDEEDDPSPATDERSSEDEPDAGGDGDSQDG